MSIIDNSSASRTGLSAKRQRVAEQYDLRLLGHRGEDRGKDVALGLHAERRIVVLVQHEAVDAHLLGIDVMLEIFVIEPAAGHRVEVFIGEHQRRGPEIQPLLGRIGRHRLLGEVHQLHAFLPPHRPALPRHLQSLSQISPRCGFFDVAEPPPASRFASPHVTASEGGHIMGRGAVPIIRNGVVDGDCGVSGGSLGRTRLRPSLCCAMVALRQPGSAVSRRVASLSS